MDAIPKRQRSKRRLIDGQGRAGKTAVMVLSLTAHDDHKSA
jgi:hypothetical protein